MLGGEAKRNTSDASQFYRARERAPLSLSVDDRALAASNRDCSREEVASSVTVRVGWLFNPCLIFPAKVPYCGYAPDSPRNLERDR